MSVTCIVMNPKAYIKYRENYEFIFKPEDGSEKIKLPILVDDAVSDNKGHVIIKGCFVITVRI